MPSTPNGKVKGKLYLDERSCCMDYLSILGGRLDESPDTPFVN
jgi:hypothetical protein